MSIPTRRRSGAAGLRSVFLAGCCAATLAAGAAAQAQEAAAPADDLLEEIIVTGSRIVRDPNATAPLPVATLTADKLRAAGSPDVTATLRQIPALLSSVSVADSREPGTAGIGQATLNLRQLGANRTLVVIDGYRHVAGVAGEQTVDVSTIPAALIERVDVLTGGASAIYGADAVTGVVNYVLKKDFDGVTTRIQGGLSGEGDGETGQFETTFGHNFENGKGNVTLSFGHTVETEVLMGDRDFTANNGRANNSTTYANPARRFQRGDINPTTMPNFANRFSRTAGRLPWGYAIPTAAQIRTLFPGGITAAEQALVDRAATAPLFVIERDPRFAISSGAGLVFRADFDFFDADINNNGVNDCRESYVGLTGFGGGGCYVTIPGGGVKIFEDGIVSTGSNQFGGDGAVERTNATSLTPRSERTYLNVRGNYDVSDRVELFGDAKFTRNNTRSRNNYNTFYDTLLILPDNPFIPQALRADAVEAGGLRISRDFLDLGPNITDSVRDTYRVVGGAKGDITDYLTYEIAGNYGRAEDSTTVGNSVLYDRLFAAIDVVRGPNGQPICRSDISNRPHPGSETFPVIAPGFFSFRPGDGTCRPVNLFNGENSVSPAGVDFITTPTTTETVLEQSVATLIFTADSSPFFELPGGAVQLVFGGEYREEKSRTEFDPLVLGLLPEGSPAGRAGTFIGDVSPNQSLIFDAQTRTFNTSGSFDVKELFGEVSLPILADLPFVQELTLGAAGRYADYSTVGSAVTWNVNGAWAPVDDVRFRGSYARAIRAPNIDELFSPAQGATFRPNDPCNASTRAELRASGAANAANRDANCLAAVRAAGIPNPEQFLANYEDPLTARFSGTSGGNPDLDKETADTWTVGTVIAPRWVEGLSISVDYYSIEIEDAIAAVTAQDIVNTCYDIDTFPNQFCALFDRNTFNTGAPPTQQSPTLFGFRFLRQTQLNFGRLETSGVDFTVAYTLPLFDGDLGMRVNGNWTEKLNRFFDPINRNLVNPGLHELSVPKWSGLGTLNYSWNGLSLDYSLQYIGKQAVASQIQIERIQSEFGEAGFADPYWVHGISVSYDVTENVQIYGGVNNLTDEEPYRASSAYPVSGIGRFFFLGVETTF